MEHTCVQILTQAHTYAYVYTYIYHLKAKNNNKDQV